MPLAYVDFSQLAANGAIRNKILGTIAIAAHSILQELVPVAARTTWAKEALASPASKADQIIYYLLAKNVGVASEQVLVDASEATYLNHVNEAINKTVAPPS